MNNNDDCKARAMNNDDGKEQEMNNAIYIDVTEPAQLQLEWMRIQSSSSDPMTPPMTPQVLHEERRDPMTPYDAPITPL